MYISVPPRTKSWYIYICITPRTKSWTTYVSYSKKTSLFRTLPVRQTSYGFILVLAIVCIFKDNILIYICSNLHLCSIYLLFYLSIYVYICTSKDKVLVYIYMYNSKDKVLDYICFLFKKTSLFRTLPVRQTSYGFVLVLAIVFIFKDNILIYICSNLHLCSTIYFSIYVYICTSKDKVLVYIYI